VLLSGPVLDAIKWFLHREGRDQNALVHELRLALQRADSDVLARADADPKLYGMGTTLTIAYSVGNDLFVAHAGDSRAYFYRDGTNKGDALNSCSKMPILRKVVLPGSSNLPGQLAMGENKGDALSNGRTGLLGS
jgi:protein phosphatase 2C-like protein